MCVGTPVPQTIAIDEISVRKGAAIASMMLNGEVLGFNETQDAA
jgi:hypothetical protein